MRSMRYAFHGHKTPLDLRQVVRLAPELVDQAARAQGEDDPEEAVSFLLDLFGAQHVQTQREKLEVILRRWVHMAPRARSLDDQERLRAIPERLAWRFDTVWPDGRAVFHLMLRAVMVRTGCSMHYAPLCVEQSDVDELLETLVSGLRAGYAASVDTQLAIELLQREAEPKVAAAEQADTDAEEEWIEITTFI
jgi:hypothetical protein